MFPPPPLVKIVYLYYTIAGKPINVRIYIFSMISADLPPACSNFTTHYQGRSQDFLRGGSVCRNFANHTHFLKITPIYL